MHPPLVNTIGKKSPFAISPREAYIPVKICYNLVVTAFRTREPLRVLRWFSGRFELKSLYFPKLSKGKLILGIGLALLVPVLMIVALFAGSSDLTPLDALKALFGQGTKTAVRIVQNIRVPRLLAAVIAGAGLSVAGLIMQTCLGNEMASPSTLGVSNAAVFGANLSIIAFAGGFLSTGHNLQNYTVGINPFSTSLVALVFAILSVLVILGLGKLRAFHPSVIVLSGVAIGAVWTAATTVLQFYATDVGLSAAVIWSFGDLGRATYRTDLILLLVVFVAVLVFALLARKYNALLSGGSTASALGIRVSRLRFFSLFLSSAITAVSVSFLGMIGFVGIICPHIAKRIFGQDHRVSIPVSLILGSLLLLSADTLSRSLGQGAALPVGAITSLLGAPFFLFLLFSKKEGRK